MCPAVEAAADGTTVAVLLFNSQAQAAAAAPVLLPVPAAPASYAVADAAAAPVTAQLLPPSAADAYLRTTYYGHAGPPVVWLAWTATLPPGGYAVYFVTPVRSSAAAPHTYASRVITAAAGAPNVTNGRLTLTFDGATGLLARYADTATGVDAPLTQELRYYAASPGDWVHALPAAGAYFMRPSANVTAPLLPAGAPAQLTFVVGPVVSEARQVFTSWASQVWRLWADASDVALQYDVGPIDIADGVGKEIISHFTAPGVANAGRFYTDSNGRDSMLRVRDARSGWNYTVLEPVAGNYYPANTARIADAGSGLTLSVFTDRAQGASSMADGSLEFNVQVRREGAVCAPHRTSLCVSSVRRSSCVITHCELTVLPQDCDHTLRTHSPAVNAAPAPPAC